MEIGQPNSAAMQATAPFGSPECTFLPPRSTFGRPESAVACMGALLVCPISIQEWFCGVWGQKNVQKALVFIKPEAIMAELDTIWVKMLLSLKHGELFSEMVLGPPPNALNWHQEEKIPPEEPGRGGRSASEECERGV